MTLDLELLEGERLAGANLAYDGIRFARSDPRSDRTFGWFEGNAPLVLGRIQRHGDGSLEIGGFWVRDDLRGRGLGREVVEEILVRLPREAPAWCIALRHLTRFYASFGMVEVDRSAELPCSIREKLGTCDATYGTGRAGERAVDLLFVPEELRGRREPGRTDGPRAG